MPSYHSSYSYMPSAYAPCPMDVAVYMCPDYSVCIPDYWRCDSYEDCPGGEDEMNCPEVGCPEDQFSCADGSCIVQSWMCDGWADCSTGEDEHWCGVTPECTDEHYTCGDDWCIPLTWTCDGITDCSEGEDEIGCGCMVPISDFMNMEAQIVDTMNFTCMQTCALTSDCLTAQYTSDGECSIFMLDEEESEGGDLYVRNRCNPENENCEDSFTMMAETKIRGGEGYPARDTYEKCEKKCLKEDFCYGFDFVTKDNPYEDTRCWIHYAEIVEAPGDVLYARVQCDY